MASWDEVSRAAPELSAAVQRIFDAHIHKVLATLRRDGSPRVSGTEVSFRDGEVWLGSMPDALKARDLQRDPRCALHSSPSDAEMTGGDAKIAGRAVEITDPAALEAMRSDEQPPGPFHLFRVDVNEVVLVTLGGDPPDHLVIESWHEGRGVRRVERR
ncbi:MAG: pyridoxamine 5'-phosphate oxidase family protein [Acidimicrobiia bacterium]